MLEAILENNRILSQFLSEFRGAFANKAQFRHFPRYVIALMIYLGDKNLSGLSRAIPDGRHQSSLYHFLSQAKWDSEKVKQVRLDVLNRKARRALAKQQHDGKKATVYLIIEDSLVEKSGKTIAWIAKYRSHKANQLVLEHIWVSAQLPTFITRTHILRPNMRSLRIYNGLTIDPQPNRPLSIDRFLPTSVTTSEKYMDCRFDVMKVGLKIFLKVKIAHSAICGAFCLRPQIIKRHFRVFRTQTQQRPLRKDS